MRKLIVISILFILSFSAAVGQKFYMTERLGFSTRTYWELAPVPYEDGLLYLSNRASNSFVDYSDQNNQDFSNIYYIRKDQDGNWENPEILSDQFVSNYHDGPVAIAQNGQMICLARAYVAELGENGRRSNPNSGLYFSSRVDENWSELDPFEHNDPDYVFYSPFLTPDGAILYFSANLDDSNGGLDIYRSELVNGRWTQPENLGSNINSAQDDVFPFLHSSGKLYFSSKGHDAFGGSDIFYSNFIEGSWTPPVKMGSPINSGSDDYSLIMSDDFSDGYFTSKRVGGTPDIFRFYSSFPSFRMPKPIKENRFCFRLRENSLDTIDYTVFYYEWVINDTLSIPGHNIRFCFPGPGEYRVSFNVTNKVTDTVMNDVASLTLQLELVEQPVITSPDTVYVNMPVDFSAEESYLPDFEIDGYFWDFDDGMKDEGVDVQHYYEYPGKYTVVLGVVEKTRNRRTEPEKVAVYKDVVVLTEPKGTN